MLYEYSPTRLQKDYENEKIMKKKYGVAISEGMLKLLGAIEAADNAYDLKCIKSFFIYLLGNSINTFM